MKDLNEIRMIKMLERKERRYYKIKKIIDDEKNPVLSFMLNIPGKEKNFKEAVDFHLYIIEEIKKILKENNIKIIKESYENLETGMEYLLEFKGDAKFVKKLMVNYEEKRPENRILDIDIYDENFKQISRSSLGLSERKCFVCDDKARTCIKEERHTQEEIEKAARNMLNFRYR